MGFMIVTAVLVVSLGRLGDIFAAFASTTRLRRLHVLLDSAVGHLDARAGAAIWLIVMRIFQALGAAMLIANSAAILTDAFPSNQRGLALGITTSPDRRLDDRPGARRHPRADLLAAGLPDLGPDRRARHGLAYLKLREIGERRAARIDWWGNLFFAASLVLIMIAITYGIQPYGTHAMG